MIFSLFKRQYLEEAYTFLRKHENFCVSLIQSVKENKNHIYFLHDELNWKIKKYKNWPKLQDDLGYTEEKLKLNNYEKPAGEIYGMISISQGGSILHCIPDVDLAGKAEESLVKIIKNHNVFSINGEKNGTAFLIEMIKKHKKKIPVHVNEYIFMEKMKTSALDSSDHIDSRSTLKTVVRRCSTEDVQSLLPLEIGFQKEEVFINDDEPSPAVYSFCLTRQIKKQYIFASFIRNSNDESNILKNEHRDDYQAVSKAAVSAISWNYALLGGVYTLQEYRRQGFSKATLKGLFDFLYSKKKTPVLFVKTKNEKAYNLYKQFGFSEISSYQIAYF